MIVDLIGINAKYIHSNPAIYSLRACTGEYRDYVRIREFTINQRMEEIRQEIYFCKKHGVENHLHHINHTGDTKAYISSLLGRVSFVLQTEPCDQEFLDYKEFLTNKLHNV